MSSIEDVIERSRQPGGFKERKRFSVARQHAIRKMREFALADPHFYVLELIQAAVANGATHVDLEIEKKRFAMSYIGGGFVQEELAQLFDFLFASKEEVAHGDIRQLALGINALMIMEPSRVVIESGDGTLEGTTRIEIEGGSTVDVGTSDEALRGTFVRASGLNRRKIAKKSNLDARDYGPPECAAIENRCLAAPVPIIVNQRPVFGYSSVRTPVLFGYKDVVTFDEGDLYGSLGVAQQVHNEMFKVSTWGVWIESLENELLEEAPLGGVVSCDRLTKTADHSGIVRDARLEQMWARLRPYAHKAQRGEGGKAIFQIAPLGGEDLEPRQLRDLLRGTDTAVVVPERIERVERRRRLASEIGETLDAPVLTVAGSEIQTLRNLAGPDTRLIEPDLTSAEELAFFEQPAAGEPERPWMVGPVELEPMEVDDFVDLVMAEEVVTFGKSERGEIARQLGAGGEIRGTIYTPLEHIHGEVSERGELWVRIGMLDRIAWEGAVISPYPGHVLHIDVPAISPGALAEATVGKNDRPLARIIAEVMARHTASRLAEVSRRALESLAHLDIEPGSAGARVALAAIARRGVKRLRVGQETGEPRVDFSLVDLQVDSDPLAAPLFETLEGESLSMRQLTEMMERTGGLVYGVVPEVEADLDGLDKSRILSLDQESERLLVDILGEAAYVRVDERDVLAEVGGFQVRDLAVGLRDYPDAPLLVEGRAVDRGRALEEHVVEELVEELVALLREDSSDGGAEVMARQAVRHLQYFVCRRAHRAPDRPTYGVEKLALFLDGRGEAATFEEVARGFSSLERLVMIDGRSSGVADLGSLTAPATDRGRGRVDALMMNTWVLGLLEPLGELVGAFDFELSDAEADDVEGKSRTSFVASVEVDGDQMSGRIGLPEEPVEPSAVAVVVGESGRVWKLRQPAIDHGVVGFIHLHEGGAEERWDDVYRRAILAGRAVLRSLVDDLASVESGPRRERVLEALFGYAGGHLQLTRSPAGLVRPLVDDELAQAIFDAPVFSTRRGIPVSAQRLINQFCAEKTRGEPLEEEARIELAEGVSSVLREWLDRHLRRENIVGAQGESKGDPVDDSGRRLRRAPTGSGDLDRWLEAWLAELATDGYLFRDAGRGGDEETAAGADQLRVMAIDPADAEARRSLPTDQLKDAVGLMSEDDLFGYGGGSPEVLLVNQSHWLARTAASKGARQPRWLAWFLLAAYSYLNALLEPVTNEHELSFQRRVADALDGGRLGGDPRTRPEEVGEVPI